MGNRSAVRVACTVASQLDLAGNLGATGYGIPAGTTVDGVTLQAGDRVLVTRPSRRLRPGGTGQ